MTAQTITPETTSCRLRVGPEDNCGEPSVLTDIGSDEDRCADHAAEVLAQTDYGWAYRPHDPRAYGYSSEAFAIELPRPFRVWP